jgi:hypothetical protein
MPPPSDGLLRVDVAFMARKCCEFLYLAQLRAARADV